MMKLTTIFTAIFTFIVLQSGCSEAEEGLDNLGSEKSCKQYCSRKYECDGVTASEDQSNACRDNCENQLEVKCGNNKQDAANEKIGECVDKTCDQFKSCLILTDTPECLAFTQTP